MAPHHNLGDWRSPPRIAHRGRDGGAAMVGIEIKAKAIALRFSEAALDLAPGNAAWGWVRLRALELAD
jgi:hypothetical protein